MLPIGVPLFVTRGECAFSIGGFCPLESIVGTVLLTGAVTGVAFVVRKLFSSSGPAEVRQPAMWEAQRGYLEAGVQAGLAVLQRIKAANVAPSNEERKRQLDTMAVDTQYKVDRLLAGCRWYVTRKEMPDTPYLSLRADAAALIQRAKS